MPESWETMLRKAEESVEPNEEFVERLSSELTSVVKSTPAPKRSRKAIGAGVAAALALVLSDGRSGHLCHPNSGDHRPSFDV